MQSAEWEPHPAKTEKAQPVEIAPHIATWY